MTARRWMRITFWVIWNASNKPGTAGLPPDSRRVIAECKVRNKCTYQLCHASQAVLGVPNSFATLALSILAAAITLSYRATTEAGVQMLAHHFATNALPKAQQLDAWRGWYDAMFDVTPKQASNDDFVATNSTWTAQGLTLSQVASPANTVHRTRSVIRRNSVDHWVITVSKQSVSDVTMRGIPFEVQPGTPFILSFGEELSISRRDQDDRVQLILARDSFQGIAPIIDAARGMALQTSAARMLADYVLLLERNVPTLEADSANRLSGAVQAMLMACLAPTSHGLAVARDQIKFTLMERVRQAVGKNLRSPSLGPTKLCREAATSRSQLYRLLEKEGGVARYIQRRRLCESFSLLCDTANTLPIGMIAETLCFSDASSFSRAFRREFDMSPGDVRAASHAGFPPAPASREILGPGARTFTDCLRGF